MFLNKKGMEAKTIVEMLLLIVAFMVLLFILLYTFAPNFMNDYWPCRLNVLFKTKIPGIGITSPLDLRLCKTHHNTLNINDENEVAKVLADRVNNCWGKYWNGKVDFFSDWSFTKEYRCMLCDVDRFNGFEDNVNIKEIEKKANENRGEEEKINLPEFQLKIEKDKPVYTTFIVVKQSGGVVKHVGESGWMGLATTAAGAVIGGAIGCVASVVCLPGIIPGAVIGAKVGVSVGIAGVPIYSATRKEVFVPSIYVFSGEEIAKTCTTLE